MSGTMDRTGGAPGVTNGTDPRECCLSGPQGDTAGSHGGGRTTRAPYKAFGLLGECFTCRTTRRRLAA
jgi:hypothetical protein